MYIPMDGAIAEAKDLKSIDGVIQRISSGCQPLACHDDRAAGLGAEALWASA